MQRVDGFAPPQGLRPFANVGDRRASLAKLRSCASLRSLRRNPIGGSDAGGENARPSLSRPCTENHLPRPSCERLCDRPRSGNRNVESRSTPASNAEEAIAEATGTDEKKEDFVLLREHQWHFSYDRRLADFTSAVSSVAFSHDGRWLAAGCGTCDSKVWDTRHWAVLATLRSSHKEKVHCLCVSPGQNWLVKVQSLALDVFACQDAWHQVQSYTPEAVAGSVWCCAAFMPAPRSAEPEGLARLAAASTTHLCLMDYSGGWHADVPQRSHSLLRFGRPRCLVFSPCLTSLLSGLETGEVLVWCVLSLSLERKIVAHTGVVHCLVSSPERADYTSRFVTCGEDRTISIWSSNWALERSLVDPHAGVAGVRSCTFNDAGTFFLSAAEEVCVWRVSCVSDRFMLEIHQRIAAVGGYEGLCSAAFCPLSGAIVAGSSDGNMGMWTKVGGSPPRPSSPEKYDLTQQKELEARLARLRQKQKPQPEVPLARPMFKVSLEGAQVPALPAVPPPGVWSQRTSTRPAEASIPELAMARENARVQPAPMLRMTSKPPLAANRPVEVCSGGGHENNVVIGSSRRPSKSVSAPLEAGGRSASSATWGRGSGAATEAANLVEIEVHQALPSRRQASADAIHQLTNNSRSASVPISSRASGIHGAGRGWDPQRYSTIVMDMHERALTKGAAGGVKQLNSHSVPPQGAIRDVPSGAAAARQGDEGALNRSTVVATVGTRPLSGRMAPIATAKARPNCSPSRPSSGQVNSGRSASAAHASRVDSANHYTTSSISLRQQASRLIAG